MRVRPDAVATAPLNLCFFFVVIYIVFMSSLSSLSPPLITYDHSIDTLHIATSSPSIFSGVIYTCST